MQILFTTSKSPLSWLIRKITGEPVSHTALLHGSYVIQSNLLGIHAEPLSKFTSSSTIVFSVDVPDNPERLLDLYLTLEGSGYDIGGLLYLGVKFLFPSVLTSRTNLWHNTGMFLCTAWVTEYLDGDENSMITPYQLYRKLSNAR